MERRFLTSLKGGVKMFEKFIVATDISKDFAISMLNRRIENVRRRNAFGFSSCT